MNGGRHIARGAGHAPVCDESDGMSLVLKVGQHRRQAVKFGHAGGLRTLSPYHHDDIPVQLSGRIGCLYGCLVFKDCCRRLDQAAFFGDGGNLDHRLAEIAVKHAKPAIRRVRIASWAQNFGVERCCRGVAPDKAIVRKHGFARIIGKVVT